MKQPEIRTTSKSPRFQLGNVYGTPQALQTLERFQVSPIELLARHGLGDWGNVCKEDAQANENALCYGGRILSVYELSESMDVDATMEPINIWIITEADRQTSTLLLPSEY